MFRHPTFLTALEIITVGLPFCVFKLLAGLLLGKWGLPLLILGGLDAVINLSNMMSVIILRRRVLPICSVCLLARAFSNKHPQIVQESAAALDVALSFLIVAIVIGGNFLDHFTPHEIKAWSIAVVLNVLGAGLFQVNQAYAKLKS